jgi:Resolvase, N terminal domain
MKGDTSMSVKIITVHTPMQGYDIQPAPIDLTRKTAVLIRQSGKKADKEYYESRLLQENLVPIAIKMRGEETDEHINLYDEGAGISGTKGYDERPELSKLYLDITNGIIGSVVVVRADRLFRDKHFINVSMFTELAEKMKVVVIVPGKVVYDFTKYNDLTAFQKHMQEAYAYIATHIKYMHEAQAQKIQRGLYGGGLLPPPYVIDRAAWKQEQVAMIYKPWVDPAVDLFQKFKDYDFSLTRIARYIEDLPCVFPFPPYEDTQRYMFRSRMSKTEKGYSFSSFTGVRYYLSNLMLGGYAKVGSDVDGNTLLLPNVFDSAIPHDLLEPAYASLTGYYLDGTPFDGIKDTRKHRVSNEVNNAILHGIITSDDGMISVRHMYAFNGRPTYECYENTEKGGKTYRGKTGLIDMHRLWSLGCHELDNIVFDRLCALARYDSSMVERIKTYFDTLEKQGSEELDVLDEQIQKTQSRIKRLDFLLKNPDIPLDTTTAVEYAKDIAVLRQNLDRLIKKRQKQSQIETENPGKTIKNFYYVLAHLETEFKRTHIDTQKQMMSRLIKQATVKCIAPHLYYLYIVWQDAVVTRPDVALLWRGVGLLNNDTWSEEMDTIIHTHYPHGNQLEILRLIPEQSWSQIKERAKYLQVTRQRQRANEYYQTVSYADLEVAMQYTEQEEDKTYMCDTINGLAKNTTRGEISPYWPLPIDVISFVSDVKRNEDKRAINLMSI